MMEKQELKTQLITLCDMAIIDRNGKLSMIGVFDVIQVQQFPGGMARAFFVATVTGSPNSEYPLVVRVDHNGETLNTVNLPAIRMSPNGKNNILFELVNFGVKEAGDYEFKIVHDTKTVGSFTLSVFQVKPQGAALGVN